MFTEVEMQKTQLAAALVAVLGLSFNGIARAADAEGDAKADKKVESKECKKECKKA